LGCKFQAAPRVGQISFLRLLAQPNLQEDRENAGNPDLVPPQAGVESELVRDSGTWGKTRLKVMPTASMTSSTSSRSA
jgi:hypothetical protein